MGSGRGMWQVAEGRADGFGTLVQHWGRECSTRGREGLRCLIPEHFAWGRECCIEGGKPRADGREGGARHRLSKIERPRRSLEKKKAARSGRQWGRKNFFTPYFQNTKSEQVYCQICAGILAWKLFCISGRYFRKGGRGLTRFPEGSGHRSRQGWGRLIAGAAGALSGSSQLAIWR
jgi:hypothetical protein